MIETPDIERPSKELVAGLAKIGSATASGELSRLGIRDPHIRHAVKITPSPLSLIDAARCTWMRAGFAPRAPHSLTLHAAPGCEWALPLALPTGGATRPQTPRK